MLGLYQDILQFLHKLLQLFPSDKRVQLTAGIYFVNAMDDQKTALVHFNKAIALDNDFAPAYNLSGYAHMALEDYTAAEEAFKNYIRLIPDKPNPYDSYAEMLLQQGKHDASIEQYQKAYEKDAEFVFALSGVADNYVFEGEYEKAREYLRQYYENAPNINQKMGALFWIAISYVHEANTESAIKTLEERASKSKSENMPDTQIDSYNLAAFVLTEAGEVDAAGKYLEMADEVITSGKMEEKDRDLFKFRAGVNRCYHVVASDDLAGADEEAEMCKKVAAERGNPGEMRFLHNNLGLLETKKGNYDQALEHFSQANMQSPYNWYYMAVAHEKNGNNEEAAKLYKKVSEWKSNSIGLAVVRARAMQKANL